MWRKRFMSTVAAGMLLAALVTFPAMAHGHGHHRQAAASVSVSETAGTVCPLEGCGQAEYHTHDGYGYWGCYPVCTEEGCSTVGHHTHDSHDCWGYYPVCEVEGCTQAGRHVHDGHSYCGYNHGCGYCDGTCGTGAGYAPCQGRRHGCR